MRQPVFLSIVLRSQFADGKARPPARLVGWTSRFLGMVSPEDEIDVPAGHYLLTSGELKVKAGAHVKIVGAFPASGRLTTDHGIRFCT